jgi:hypothetical protein
MKLSGCPPHTLLVAQVRAGAGVHGCSRQRVDRFWHFCCNERASGHIDRRSKPAGGHQPRESHPNKVRQYGSLVVRPWDGRSPEVASACRSSARWRLSSARIVDITEAHSQPGELTANHESEYPSVIGHEGPLGSSVMPSPRSDRGAVAITLKEPDKTGARREPTAFETSFRPNPLTSIGGVRVRRLPSPLTGRNWDPSLSPSIPPRWRYSFTARASRCRCPGHPRGAGEPKFTTRPVVA